MIIKEKEKFDTNLFEIPINNKNFTSLSNNIIKFNDDKWDLSPLITHNLEGLSLSRRIINFSKCKEPLIRNILKKYTWITLAKGNKKATSICSSINDSFIQRTYKFLDKNKFKTFEEFDLKKIYLIIDFLKDKCLSPSSINSSIINMLEILNTSFTYKWEGASKKFIVLDDKISNILGLKKYEEFKKTYDKSVPDDIFNQIIYYAINVDDYLLEYRNKKPLMRKGFKMINLAKFGILIQSYTGLRISEILTLKYDCLEIDDENNYWLNYTSSKTKKEPITEKIIISKETKSTTEKLINLSQPYRDYIYNANTELYNGIKNNIFFSISNRKDKIITVPRSNEWSVKELKRFIKRNDIQFRKETNKYILYPLKSHQFRHTFAKNLINSGVPIRVIERHYAHVSIDMTNNYITLKNKKLESDYIDTFLKSDYIYSSGSIGDEFKDIVNNLKLEKDLSDIIDELSKRFGINPLPMGMCLMDFKKGHCTNTGSEGCYYSNCKDFVSNSNFLNTFYKQKELIETEIERTKDNKFAKMTFQVNLKKKKKLDEIINKIEARKSDEKN